MSGQPDVRREVLESVLTEERQAAKLLRDRGYLNHAADLERIIERVSDATEEYRTFIPESDAVLRTGKSVDWLRARYPEWESQGHARKVRGVRTYRLIILPVRTNLSAAREAGRNAVRVA